MINQRRVKRFNIKGLRDYPVSAIKQISANGKRYVYHRASGSPLPDMDFGHPEFITAFLQAEADHKNRTAASQQKFKARPPSIIQNHEPPITPNAIVYNVEQIISWMHVAATGDVLYYHFGSLLTDSTSEPVSLKRSYTKLMSDFGVITLRQRRVSDGVNHYYAIRTDDPISYLPQNVLTGTVTADEYTAIVAISERQASISVARVIRDALGITDDQASQIRNDFIRRGMMTNGRPPQLTELGLSALI